MESIEMLDVVEREQFAITDDQKADWAIQKIKEAAQELAHWQAFYNDRLAAVRKSCEQKTQHLNELLRGYLLSDEVKRHETKTTSKYALPSGELVLTKPKVELAKRDEAALLAWAKENGEKYVRVKEESAWSVIKAYIKESGEVPPGVEWEEQDAKFEVR